MSVGGNQRARSFFKQHGWDEIGSDKIEAKYTSRAAQLYRKQLEKDAAKAMSGEGEDSKPAASAKAVMSATNGAAAAASAAATRAAVGASKARLANPRRGGGMKLGGGGGLGIKKISSQVDDSLFEQAPVVEEAAPTPVEDAETLEDAVGAPAASSRFNMDTMEEKRRPPMPRGKDGHLTLDASNDFFSDPLGKRGAGASETRSPTGLSSAGGGGFGGGAKSMSGSRRGATSAVAEADSGAAQARFGNAKSISSSAFFNDEQKESDYERQGKLNQFQGSTAISSDAYFGRESSSQGGDNLDASAADLVSKISLTARQDVQQLKAMASDAGTKLSRMAQSFMRDLQGGF